MCSGLKKNSVLYASPWAVDPRPLFAATWSLKDKIEGTWNTLSINIMYWNGKVGSHWDWMLPKVSFLLKNASNKNLMFATKTWLSLKPKFYRRGFLEFDLLVLAPNMFIGSENWLLCLSYDQTQFLTVTHYLFCSLILWKSAKCLCNHKRTHGRLHMRTL